MLEFDWDEANSAHIAAHGVSCDEAEQVLRGDPFDLDYQSGTEERFRPGWRNAGWTDLDRHMDIAQNEGSRRNLV